MKGHLIKLAVEGFCYLSTFMRLTSERNEIKFGLSRFMLKDYLLFFNLMLFRNYLY